MSTLWVSDQVKTIISTQGVAVAGILGAPNFVRSTEVRGLVKVYHFNVEQALMNPMPGSPDGDIASGDSIIIALLKPTDRIYFGRIYNNAWGGTSTLMSVGKNNPNTPNVGIVAAHYLSAQGIDTGGVNDINLNIGEQVGADPAGDQSVGNQIPGFGALPVQITLTIVTSAFATGGTINGFLFVVEEGN